MKFSPAVTLTIAVMALLVVALIILAFFLGNQYAVMNMARSTKPPTNITEAEQPVEQWKPQQILPSLASEKFNMEQLLHMTVLPFREASLGEQVSHSINTAGHGASYAIESAHAYVSLSDIVYDSRCPEEVDCLVAGEAIAEVLVQIGNNAPQTVYLSSWSGGKPDFWTSWKPDSEYVDQETIAEIQRMQEIAKNTEYVQGEKFNEGGAIVGNYTISLRGLTPNRTRDGESARMIPKKEYVATLVFSKR